MSKKLRERLAKEKIEEHKREILISLPSDNSHKNHILGKVNNLPNLQLIFN